MTVPFALVGFLFLIILLELSHATLISKFSHPSLMAFLKVHLCYKEQVQDLKCPEQNIY